MKPKKTELNQSGTPNTPETTSSSPGSSASQNIDSMRARILEHRINLSDLLGLLEDSNHKDIQQ